MRIPSLRLLAERGFALLWAGQALSAVGSALVPVALAFAVLSVSDSAAALGLVLASGFVSRLVFLLVGGIVGDRRPRKRVMVAADSLRAVSEALVAVLLLTGSAQVWQLVCLFALYGAADAFFTPASVAIVSDAVRPERRQEANALLSLPVSTASVVCPALAGLLVVTAGAGVVFALDAVTFAISAVTLAAARLPARTPTTAGTGMLDDLRAGWKQVAARRWVSASIAYFAVSNLAVAPLYVLGPLVAKQELGGPEAWGLIATCGGIGSVAGDVVALHLRPRRPLAPSFLFLATWALEPALLARPFPAAVIAGAAAVGGAALAFSNAMWFTTLQERIPGEALSRVSSFDWLGSRLFQPFAYALVGPIAAVIGIPATLVAGAVVHASASVAVAFTPSVRSLERTPRRTKAVSEQLAGP
jgi:MFS family permease